MDFSIGQHVEWDTPQGSHQGTILERHADDFHFARQRFTASSDEPVYVVESHDTGATGAHRPQALRRV